MTAPVTTIESALLRIATAGSVDDGKSTLIGRLLYDSKAILADQLEQVQEASERRSGEGGLDLSLLTDGLRAEREQGITIDVAYRYFQTARRKFVLADTPGHVQYTRNMVTGASTADVAIILIDARHGVVEQTRRHTFIASLLGIPHLAVCVNKMDLVDYAEDVFDGIVRDFCALAKQLGVKDVEFFPISAKLGDNVVDASAAMNWYSGTPLLEHLETLSLADDEAGQDTRFPVQWVIRDHDADYRGYAGTVAGGVLRAGDAVVVLPSGVQTTIAAVETIDGELDAAFAPMSVTVRLADNVDASRGDMIARAPGATNEVAPLVTRELSADVSWMAEAPLRPGARLALKHTTSSVRAIVEGLDDVVDIATLERVVSPDELALNDIGRVRLRVSKPLAVDPYERNRTTGSFILIYEATNESVGAGMIR
ncbi:MAG: sulfate adenylyltransferase [Solirubrobacterales bacterium]|nr:sulfate adenylyltransferase [Solirubrobacterales bacterium]